MPFYRVRCLGGILVALAASGAAWAQQTGAVSATSKPATLTRTDASTPEAVPVDETPKVTIAVLHGTNKITGRTTPLEAAVGTLERFGNLEIVVQKCENSPATVKPKESAALVDVWELKPSERPMQIFTGWLFATNASLSGLQHPVYDITLVRCTESAELPH